MNSSLTTNNLERLLAGTPHTPRPTGVPPGELALMKAVLEDAIDCYLGRAKRRRVHPKILEREAEYWIQIEDWEAPFSFNNVCEALGLDPDWTRRALRRMKAIRTAGAQRTA